MPDPFRSPDLEARVAALRTRRAAATAELAEVQSQRKQLRPWSYRRFFLAASWPLVLVAAWLVWVALKSLMR